MTNQKQSVVYVKFDGVQKGKEGEVFTQTDDEKPQSKSLKNQIEKNSPDIYNDIELNISRGTMGATYTKKEVAKLFSITEGRLSYWDKTDFISPSGFKANRRCYSFSDLISVRSAIALLEKGVTLQKTRVMISNLDKMLPSSTHPLGKLRITGDSDKVVVSEDGKDWTAESGQLIFDFTVEKLEEQVVSKLPEHVDQKREPTAYEWYLNACSLDESEATFDAAEHAYHKAIALDPTLASAYTNLGNLRFRQGSQEDARALYIKALEIDDFQPEAHYNLGFLDYDDDDFVKAKAQFETAIKQDPSFADGFYNLAMTLVKIGEEDQASVYLKKYLEFEPVGTWAEIARQHLN